MEVTYLKDVDIEFENLIKAMNRNDRFVNEELLRNCYNLAKFAHQKQRRKTGEPYLIHPVAVAKILANFGFESNIIAAALCHDVLEDSKDEYLVNYNDLVKTSNVEVADLVNAVSAIKQTTDNLNLSKDELDELSIRKFIDEAHKHKFAYYIKLADRLHNLRTLDAMPLDKQIGKVNETKRLLLPIARELKAHYFVGKLEELCFKYENRFIFERLYYDYMNELRLRAGDIKEFESILKYITSEDYRQFHSYVVYKRSMKNIYQMKTTTLNNINYIDIDYANDEIPLKNYILKVFDYDSSQAIKKFFSIYKKDFYPKGFLWIGHGEELGDKRRYVLLQDQKKNTYKIYLMTVAQGLAYNIGSLEHINITNDNDVDLDELLNRKIFVYKRDGNKMEIQEGATVLDFAFYIHKDIGLCAYGVLLNDVKLTAKSNDLKDNPLFTVLNQGDKVEVLSDTSPQGKSNYHVQIDWLEYVKTKRAKRYIISYLKTKYQAFLSI